MAKTYQKRAVKKEAVISTTTTTVPPLETPSIKSETTSDIWIAKRKSDYSIKITTGEKWYRRIWNYVTNPFTYIFGGKIRF